MSDIKYVVIELDALHNDWTRNNATFVQKMTAPSASEAIARVRDWNEYEIKLGDLIAIPEELYIVSNRYGGERGHESI